MVGLENLAGESTVVSILVRGERHPEFLSGRHENRTLRDLPGFCPSEIQTLHIVSSIVRTMKTLVSYDFPLWGLQFFFVAVASLISVHFSLLFLDRHGWTHRLAGAVHFFLLVVGAWAILPQTSSHRNNALFYDVALGCSGVVVTLTASRDFPHRYVRNNVGQSGSLSDKAMVTQAEMMEHAFYEFLNLWQALYLHFMASQADDDMVLDTQSVPLRRRWCALLVVTAPWWFRRRFPVHSFSHNWTKQLAQQHTTSPQKKHEALLYRIKKWQYIFYKHVILHGVNLSICVAPAPLVAQPSWRLFWICLNTSYVMEFFLQSLVKRQVVLTQTTMLMLNRWLMLVSTCAAWSVLATLRWELCLASLVLNFVHRYHDVWNTMAIGSLALYYHHREFASS